MSIEPFTPFATVNTTTSIDAPRSSVWAVVKAMERWSDFQDNFDIELVDGGVVELGQQILITAKFPIGLSQTTLEEYDEIIERERICWTLRGFQFFGSLTIDSPPSVLRTARCIELFDNYNGGTDVHNWISYAGVGWPAVVLGTGLSTRNLFNDFNEALAGQFV